MEEKIVNRITLPEAGAAGHVESYFMKGNDLEAQKAFWLKFTFYRPSGQSDATVAEVWAIVFDMTDAANHRAAKETFSLSDCTLERDPVRIQTPKAQFADGKTKGAIETDGVAISWDLQFGEGDTPNRYFPHEWMYTKKIPKSKIVTPHPDTTYTGWIEAGGNRWNLDAVRGMQGHNWGSEHTWRYVWGHCNVFSERDDVVFEGYSGRVKMGPFVLPFLSQFYLRLGDLVIECPSLKLMRQQSVSLDYYLWRFDVTYGDYRLAGRIEAPQPDLVGLYYHNPNGSITHCLNSKIADAVIAVYKGDELLQRLHSPRACALELAVREQNHGVKMHV